MNTKEKLSSPVVDLSLLIEEHDTSKEMDKIRTEDNYSDYEKNQQISKRLIQLQKKFGNIFGNNLFKK